MEAISKKVKVTLAEEGMRSFAEQVRESSHGGKVLLFAQEGRTGDDARAALALAGMKVVRQDLNRAVLSDYSILSDRAYPEDCMAVAGVGGAAQMEAAKTVRLGKQAARILYPTELGALCALDERSFFATKGEFLMLRSEGHSVLFDQKALCAAKDVRAGLGLLLARLIEETDGVYEALIREGKSPASALGVLRKRFRTAGSLREEECAAGVARVAFSLLGETPLSAGESAHLLAIAAAKQTGGQYPDFLFTAAYCLYDLYLHYLNKLPLEHCPPPDRARSVDALGEMGWDSSVLYANGKLFAEGYEARAKATAEYREDFSEALREDFPFVSYTRLYRRAPREKDGKRLSARDLLALLSLTGEAVSGYPLLRHIKMTGILEPLLIAG
ncbi:MAG TPA: hypothetical protein DIC18_03235 [Clostridiales bacterium]|nr:hypothetical protein [Clostridiales bacterium]